MIKREAMIERARSRRRPWDMLVIGGGATGVGIAVDAAARGYDVLLVEQSDFGKGTSSRSTKLVHGGVRYLQQGNVPLVIEALRERGMLRRNAPHLVHDQKFIVPNYTWWEAPWYGIGLKVYDLLARKYSFGRSKLLGKNATLAAIPALKTEGLLGGVLYHDGQFDDARLLISLARTAADHGATLVNYCRAEGLTKNREHLVDGVELRDVETDATWTAAARVVINATGPFADGVRRLDRADARPMIAPSQGVHVVLDRGFLRGSTAIMVPRTSDGRVLFAIPWHDRVVVGTTDTPIDRPTLEPRARADEIAFILETAADYLEKPPAEADVLSVFTGIRPLVRAGDAGESTAALSRDHTIDISRSGLLTIAGGKWTTYRRMAEDCVDHAATLAELEPRPCPTHTLAIHGACEDDACVEGLEVYGRDGLDLKATMRGPDAEPFTTSLSYTPAEVRWAARYEMARTVDDVLARRSRCLLLDARAAVEIAPAVARTLAEELGRDPAWQAEQVEAFGAIATGYMLGDR